MQFCATKTSDKLTVNIDHVYCTLISVLDQDPLLKGFGFVILVHFGSRVLKGKKVKMKVHIRQ